MPVYHDYQSIIEDAGLPNVIGPTIWNVDPHRVSVNLGTEIYPGTILAPVYGGTGTNQVPAANYFLLGNSFGTYTVTDFIGAARTTISAGTGISYNASTGVISAINLGTVTSVGVSGANGIGVSGSPITSSGTIALSLGNITPSSVAASGTVTGSNLSGTNTGDLTLTGEDYLSFNGNQEIKASPINLTNTNVTGLSAAAICFGKSGGGGIAQDIANLVWDDTNNRLGIGTNAPSVALHLASGQAFLGGSEGTPSVGTYGGSADRIIVKTGGASTYPIAIGTDGTRMWSSVPTGKSYRWYIEGSQTLDLSATGLSIGTTTANSSITLYNGNESPTLTDFTQALTKSGINIITDYTNGSYTPGIFWSTQNDNATKPKAGIWMLETSSGSIINIATSNDYSVGITNLGIVLDYNTNTGIGVTPVNRLDVSGGTAIGSYAGSNTAPSNGLIVSGPVYMGGHSITYGLASSSLIIYNGLKASVQGYTLQLVTSDSSSPLTLQFSNLATATSANQGYILQSTVPGISYNPIYLQPYGGGVAIGYQVAAPSGGLIVSGDVLIGTSSATGGNLAIVKTSANAIVDIRTTTSGNPIIGLTTGGQQDWSLGIDRSDSGKFKIGTASFAPGTNTKFSIDTAGNVSILAGDTRLPNVRSILWNGVDTAFCDAYFYSDTGNIVISTKTLDIRYNKLNASGNYGTTGISMDTTGTVLVYKNLFADKNSTGDTSTNLSIALGDGDTGLDWVSDGVFRLINNNVETARVSSNLLYTNVPVSIYINNTIALTTRNTTSSGIGVGSGIFLDGKYTSGGDYTTAGGFGAIIAVKENGTSGDQKGQLGLYVNDGSSMTRAAYIESSYNYIQDIGNIKINTAGKTLCIREGSNACMGIATLSSGVVTVSTTAVTANSRIFITVQSNGGTEYGHVRVSTRTAGTSFTITSYRGANSTTVASSDSSVVGWVIHEPT